MKAAWKVGDVIENRWEINSVSAGGMSHVYFVLDREWGVPLVAKTFMSDQFAQEELVKERFAQEALAWIRMDSHPNIAKALIAKKIEGRLFIFSEYIGGGDLGILIREGRLRNDLPAVLRLSMEFCDGMTYALSTGIRAHRDVKPSNCLLTPTGSLKITDFGLASISRSASGSAPLELENRRRSLPPRKLLSDWSEQSESTVVPMAPETRGARLTRTGQAMGTPHYMAPEQFWDFKNVDVRADVYSFGVMLFEMLTGSLPFRAVNDTWEEWQYWHTRGRVAHLAKEFPKRLDVLLKSCLEKEPGRRFTEFTPIREILADLYREITGEVAPPSVRTATLDTAQLSRRGVGFAELGMIEEAISCFHLAIYVNPGESSAWYNKANTLAYVGRLEEALHCINRAIDNDASDGLLWALKGALLLGTEGQDEALRCANIGVGLGNGDWRAWKIRTEVLLAMDMHDEAIATCRRTLELNGRCDEAWLSLSIALIKRGDPRDAREALAALEQALELNPAHSGKREEVGWLANSQGNRSEAEASSKCANSYSSAAAWYRVAAQLDVPSAQYNLARMYQNGWGVEQDYVEAARLFALAARAGLVEGKHWLAMSYRYGKGLPENLKEAARLFREAAESGYAKSQAQLASMLLTGEGVGQNVIEAYVWLSLAAHGGDLEAAEGRNKLATVLSNQLRDSAGRPGIAAAMHNLGFAYYEGKGTAQNYAEAARWFKEAAVMGYTHSQFNLGLAYKNGQGVEEDLVEAYAWMHLAAMQGDREALCKRDSLAKRMSADEISRSRTLIRKLETSDEGDRRVRADDLSTEE